MTTHTVEAELELSVDDLAARSGLPTRTIREYQTMGLLTPPERRGRVGVYRAAHLRRLELIGRLQVRGYSLAGIRDLFQSWAQGADLHDVLGLSPDELVHADEPGAPTTLAQLTAALPTLVPTRLDDLVDVGLIDDRGDEGYCIPSPSLVQLAVEMLDVGYTPDQLMRMLRAVRDAADLVANEAQALLAAPPPGLSTAALSSLATRGRGLLAHATGRMAIYRLGQLTPPVTRRGRNTRGR